MDKIIGLQIVGSERQIALYKQFTAMMQHDRLTYEKLIHVKELTIDDLEREVRVSVNDWHRSHK